MREVGRAASLVALWISLSLVLWAPAAKADLASDAADLATRWSERGLATTRLPTLFLEHGRGRPVRAPEPSFEPGGPACTTIAFLTGRSTDFVVRFEPVVSLKHHASG